MGSRRSSVNVYQVGTAVTLVSISAFFLALILVFFLRIREQPEWQHFRVPSGLWLSTSVLVMSSAALELSRYFLRRGRVAHFRAWLQITLGLGFTFLVIQMVALNELATAGVAMGQNLHGSAFYIFMGLHGLHLIVGIGWLGYLLYRSSHLRDDLENALRRHRYAVGAASLYWHFMGGLWVVLFALLMQWSQAI